MSPLGCEVISREKVENGLTRRYQHSRVENEHRHATEARNDEPRRHHAAGSRPTAASRETGRCRPARTWAERVSVTRAAGLNLTGPTIRRWHIMAID